MKAMKQHFDSHLLVAQPPSYGYIRNQMAGQLSDDVENLVWLSLDADPLPVQVVCNIAEIIYSKLREELV